MKKFLAGALAVCLCFTGLFLSCGEKKKNEIYVYTPDGAPALAFAYAMHGDSADDGVSYEVVNPATIESYLTYRDEEKNADICALPLNTASKLLGSGEKYQLVGTVTNGNLYLLSDGGVAYNRENLALLKGKTVGVVQLANVPGIVFKMILTDLNIPYAELKNGEEAKADKVNLKAVAPDTLMPTKGIDAFVAPEPQASVKVLKTSLEFVGSLQELYGGEKGFPQAVVVAKRSLLKKNPQAVEKLVKKLVDGAQWLETAEISSICGAVSSHLTKGLTPSLTEKNLSRLAIENSSVWFTSAQARKAEINEFLAKMVAVGGAASAVDEAFFAK